MTTTMTTSNSLDGLLEKAVELAYQAVLAISQGDLAGARKQVDQLRFVKASAKPNGARHAFVLDSAAMTDASLKGIRGGLEALELSEQVIQGWIQQRIHSVASGEVSNPMEIWQCLIDQALPASWDFDVDLFVVLGNPDSQLSSALELRGQRRVLFVVDEAPSELFERSNEALLASSDAEICGVIGGLHRPYPGRVTSLSLREGGETDEVAVEQMASIHKYLLMLQSIQSTRKYFGKTWLEQGVGNLPLLASHRNLHELDGAFKGLPALLIAPGPSLERNIDQIKALKGKALLLAPLQTLRRLYLADIQPDFLVVLDPADQTVEPVNFFQGVPVEFLPPLIAAVNSHPSVLEKFKTVYFYSSNGPLDNWMVAAMGEPLLPLSAPSVAVTGFLLARHWQCSPIILTGQDLALKGGQQYAAGSNLKPSKRRLYSLPGYFGGVVQSPSDYYMFHHQFERLAKDISQNQPHLELFNCTEGGAFIKGFEHRALQEVVTSHLTHVTECSAGARAAQVVYSDAAVLQRKELVRRHLEKSLQLIDASIKQADQCRRLTKGVVPAGSKFFKRLESEERNLRGLIKNIAGFSILYQEDMDRALKASAQATTLRENLEASRALYAVVTDGCAVLRPLVLRAMDRCVAWQQSTAGCEAKPSVAA